ncbi:MAG: hypothetical protein M3277_12440 [Actinomycetota bacterium]|nr:hypothetical protein [Actinomycetota bacterium]
MKFRMSSDEDVAAQVVQALAPDVLARPVGPPRARDARGGSGLTVDYTFDDTTPPVALEVTTIHAPDEPQLWSEIKKKLDPALTSAVKRERLGSWILRAPCAVGMRVGSLMWKGRR